MPAPSSASGLAQAWARVRDARMARYLIAAVAGAAVDFSVFALLVYGAGVHYLWAGVGGFVVATLANYLVSVRIVFQSGSRFPRLMEIGVVYAVSATGLVWHQILLFLCVERFALHLMLAKMIAVGCVFFWNYSVRRHFVFARAPARR